MLLLPSQNHSINLAVFIHVKLIDMYVLCVCLEEKEYRLTALVSSDQSDQTTERSERLAKSQRPLPPVPGPGPGPRCPPSPPYM